MVQTYHPRKIIIWDDNFFVNLNRVNAFLDEYIKKKYTFDWWAHSRADTFAKEDKKFLKRLRQCNCRCISMGAESGSPRILKLIKKHIIPSDILASCKNISKYGILPDYSVISGFPGETVADLYQTLNLIQKIIEINPNTGLRLYNFFPLPGTPILEECVKYGFVYPDTMCDWSIYEFYSYIAPWLTKQHQKLIKSIIWITAFVSPKTKPTAGRWYVDLLLEFLHYDAKWRLRHNFYSLAFEWIIFYSLYKRHYKT